MSIIHHYSTALGRCLLVLLLAGSYADAAEAQEALKPGAYRFNANDPDVDLKRRDVLPPDQPTEPEEILATFEVAEGFRVELFAAEPLVADPVAMEVDEEGRAYVVELHGYPDDESGRSTIKLLKDTDGDGRPDESTVFADSLVQPKGIMRWKQGLLVTDAPDVLYLEDTDGDGRADVRDVVLTGFGHSNPQLGVNTPLYGLDNWIYLAHRMGSDAVRFPERPGLAYDVSRRNLFRPGAYAVEALAANSQFGQTFDAWGRHFLVRNDNPFYHEVVAARYLQRNPHLLIATPTEDLSSYGSPPTVFPITADEAELGRGGGVTSASGITNFLGGTFPAAYDGALFVGEPVYNVVHAARLTDEGATFAAHRMLEGREFLASTDRWFRPVNLYIGPDGALYVIDYARQIIEQPRFLTPEVLEAADLYNGSGRGRIYRIVPEGAPPPDWLNALDLGMATTERLVQALERPNVWWRRTAQRLLVDRGDSAAAPPLERLAEKSTSPEARVHALWTLEGLGALTAPLIEQALGDRAPGVRENAVRLAELHHGREPRLVEALLAMEETDAHVRYQLLCTLGEIETEAARSRRRELLFEDVEDPWIQVAALSAHDVDAPALYELAIDRLTDQETEARKTFFRRIGALIGVRQQSAAARRVVRASAGPSEGTSEAGSGWWRAASLAGLAEGMRRTPTAASLPDAERDLLLATFFESDPDSLPSPSGVRDAYLAVLRAAGLPKGAAATSALEQAAAVAADRQAPPTLRADAVRLMTLSNAEHDTGLIKALVNPQEPAPVQTAAMQALGQREGPEAAAFLLDRWREMTPSVRSAAVEVLLDSPERVDLLLGAIEAGTVSPTAIPRHRAEKLVEHENARVRRQARRALRSRSKRRREVVERYEAALEMRGRAEDGRRVFQRACSAYHQIGGAEGQAYGPDLAALENWPPRWLMRTIIVPGEAVADGYELWTVEQEGGRRTTGLIAGETPTSITLRSGPGVEATVPRADVQSMKTLTASAMPEGLESQITVREMADLLAFLMSVQTVE